MTTAFAFWEFLSRSLGDVDVSVDFMRFTHILILVIHLMGSS